MTQTIERQALIDYLQAVLIQLDTGVALSPKAVVRGILAWVVRTAVVLVVLACAAPAVAQPLPAAVCAALTAKRQAIPGIPTPAQHGAILNATAWESRATGIGVSKKLTGNHCPSPAGDIACDVLMLKDGTYWDVFYAVGQVSRVVCGSSPGKITNSARGWLAPADPGETPPVVPPPVVCPSCPPDQSATVAQLRVDLANMTAERDRVYAQLQEWNTRLIASDAKLAAVGCRAWVPIGIPGVRIPARCEVTGR